MGVCYFESLFEEMVESVHLVRVAVLPAFYCDVIYEPLFVTASFEHWVWGENGGFDFGGRDAGFADEDVSPGGEWAVVNLRFEMGRFFNCYVP